MYKAKISQNLIDKKCINCSQSILKGCHINMSNSNFQEIVKKLKKSVKEQEQENIPIEEQMKLLRLERERQEEIDQEYQRRKEAASERLLQGLESLKAERDQ